jgi:signal transduction histidine kinase
VEIRVIDSGKGIDPEELPLIWNKFYRSPRSKSQPGFGLGLALVKAIVEAHHGTVSAQNRPGRGAVFTVFLV